MGVVFVPSQAAACASFAAFCIDSIIYSIPRALGQALLGSSASPAGRRVSREDGAHWEGPGLVRHLLLERNSGLCPRREVLLVQEAGLPPKHWHETLARVKAPWTEGKSLPRELPIPQGVPEALLLKLPQESAELDVCRVLWRVQGLLWLVRLTLDLGA